MDGAHSSSCSEWPITGAKDNWMPRSVQLVGGALIVVIAALMPWLRSTTAAAQGSSQWVAQSPVPFLASGGAATLAPNYNTYHSGRVSSIAVDPRDASRWLVGVGNGGVWETRDGGTSFNPITDEAPTLATGAIAFAPGNPDTIYVG